MSDLDDKLRDIIIGLPDPDGGISDGDMDDGIAQIKQVFTHAGYITPTEVAKWQKTVNTLADSLTQAMQLPTKHYVALNKKQQTMQDLMTGAEWYYLCLKVIEDTHLVGDPKTCARMVIAKAAGIYK